MNGKKPTNAPIIEVIIRTAIIGDEFNANIINNETQEIKAIPEDRPSNPSIKLIAFVIPTIQIIVANTDIS